MPFPALSLPISIAIGVPIGLAGFVAQEAILRRRSARRQAGASTGSEGPPQPPPSTIPSSDVTVKPAPRARAPKPRSTAPTAAALRKQEAALNQGLEAVITFVDGAPRRAAAATCADSLLLALPAKLRGPALAAFLHAAGAKQPPGKLQELAEDVGVELATALRRVKSDLSKRPQA